MRTLKALRVGICLLALTGCSVTMGTATPVVVHTRDGYLQMQECKLTISNYFLIEYYRIDSCRQRMIKLPE
jgi:hypothetical protein